MKLAAAFCFFTLSAAAAVMIGGAAAAGDDDLQTKCAPEFTKLTYCLDYASAKAAAPSTQCCGSAAEIRGTAPACLCYIIQQVHGGLPSVKSLGLQFQRLLQLPSACSLPNASISNCPKLLNLPPGSPDNAIFNGTKEGAASAGAETSTGSSTTGTPAAAANPAIAVSPVGGVVYVIVAAAAAILLPRV